MANQTGLINVDKSKFDLTTTKGSYDFMKACEEALLNGELNYVSNGQLPVAPESKVTIEIQTCQNPIKLIKALTSLRVYQEQFEETCRTVNYKEYPVIKFGGNTLENLTKDVAMRLKEITVLPKLETVRALIKQQEDRLSAEDKNKIAMEQFMATMGL